MADPNWFFSTLAQSTAAIVGLTGGFFVQRLLSQREALANRREPLRRAFLDLETEVSARRREAELVAASLDAVGDLLEAAHRRGDRAEAVDVRTQLTLMTPSGVQSTRGTEYTIDTRMAGEFRAAAVTMREFCQALPVDVSALMKTPGSDTKVPEWLQKEPRSQRLPASVGKHVEWLPEVVRDLVEL